MAYPIKRYTKQYANKGVEFRTKYVYCNLDKEAEYVGEYLDAAQAAIDREFVNQLRHFVPNRSGALYKKIVADNRDNYGSGVITCYYNETPSSIHHKGQADPGDYMHYIYTGRLYHWKYDRKTKKYDYFAPAGGKKKKNFRSLHYSDMKAKNATSHWLTACWQDSDSRRKILEAGRSAARKRMFGLTR